jgi:hypothetical protein
MCVDEKREDLAFPYEDEVVYSPDVGYKEDLQRVHNKIDDLAKRLPVQGSQHRTVHWYGYPLLLVIIGVTGSGLCGYLVARWQLTQTRADASLDQRIDNHVDNKLQPINEGIGKLREDVAYLKAKVEDATTKKIDGFSRLPADKIAVSLSDISKTLAEARTKELISPPDSVAELRNKLAQVHPTTPEFWDAVSNLITYQSLIAEKINLFPNAENVRDKPCELIHVGPGASFGGVVTGRANGCMQQLDIGADTIWRNFTFENSIIVYKGGPINLDNVTFKNCLFFVEFPLHPPPPTQKFGETLLATSGVLKQFTCSTS